MAQHDNSAPMEIDPVDDGPKQGPMLGHCDYRSPNHVQPRPMSITQEDDARQAIEMLRGDDVSGRVSAANRLEAVAAALGEVRAREVSIYRIVNSKIPFTSAWGLTHTFTILLPPVFF